MPGTNNPARHPAATSTKLVVHGPPVENHSSRSKRLWAHKIHRSRSMQGQQRRGFPQATLGRGKLSSRFDGAQVTTMREQNRTSRIRTASFPPPLHRGQGSRRLLLLPLFLFNCQSSELEVHIDHRLISSRQACFVTEATRHRYSIRRLLCRPGCREVTFRHGRF